MRPIPAQKADNAVLAALTNVLTASTHILFFHVFERPQGGGGLSGLPLAEPTLRHDSVVWRKNWENTPATRLGKLS